MYNIYASIDKGGNIHIWDAKDDEHKLVYQYKFLAGSVKDLDWDVDNKRIIVVGEGSTGNAHVFMFDSGNTVGHISGHSKAINACSFRTKRPFCAVTGSEDRSVILHEGPPYKFSNNLTGHQSFVNDVRYSPSGDYFVTVGADKMIFLYDGKTGEKVREIGPSDTDKHTGAINAVSWSPDSQHIATSSSDQTVNIWKVDSGNLIRTIRISDTNSPQNHQVGNTWADGDNIISVSLSGNINILSKDSDTPIKVITGMQHSITASTLNRCKKLLYTTSYDGRIRAWDLGSDDKVPEPVAFGNDDAYSTGITEIASSSSKNNDLVVFGALDDKIHLVNTSGKPQSDFNSNAIATGSAPSDISIIINDGGQLQPAIVATLKNKKAILVVDGKVIDIATGNHATAITSSPTSSEIAIGFDDGTVKTFTVNLSGSNSVEATGVVIRPTQREVSALAYTPDGTHLASGDASGKVALIKSEDGSVVTLRWVFHSARVLSLNWAPDGVHLASSSLDCHIAIWNRERFGQSIRIRHAHTEGVGYVDFLNDSEIVSVGCNSGIKKWQITY